MCRSTGETMAKQKFLNPHIIIWNSPGCHGHYLRYLIDRLSRKTPTIEKLPFNENGASHLEIGYSGFAEYVEPHHHRYIRKQKNSNIVKIIFTNDILYYERVAMNRAGDTAKDLHNLHKDISCYEKYNKEFYDKLISMYNVVGDTVPKWLLRDSYKLGFLDWQSQGSVVMNENEILELERDIKPHNKVHYVEVNVFFNLESLKSCLMRLDDFFHLDLDLTPLEEIHKEFVDKNIFVQTNKQTDIVLQAIKNKEDIVIPKLDIIQEAYVYAMLEKQNNFIQMPLTDHFFKRTKEVIDYIDCYPKHYKSMNPGLPEFNNKENPFFIKNKN